jgi:hypothetical protein
MTRSWANVRSWVGRVALTAVAAGALAAGGGLVGAGSARAATATVTDSTVGETPFVVPAGVTGVTVALTGAPGGSGHDPNFPADDVLAGGGGGGTVRAAIGVTPGEVLFVEVGGAGGAGTAVSAGAGGVNGGGAGGQQAKAGGGGGASDIRTCSVTAGNALDPGVCAMSQSLATRLLVAGGGGGGGGSGSAGSTVFGGLGGAAGSGGGAGNQGAAPAGGGGGLPGTATAGGAAGTSSGSGSDSAAAQPGATGVGGTGGDEDGTDFGGGGGGGGGLFGGGGAGGGECVPHSTSVCGAGGGGAGGASGAPAAVEGVSGVQTGTAAAGSVPEAVITWTLPTPTVITGPVSGLASTSAQLNGTLDANGSSVTECQFTITPSPASGPVVPCGAAGIGATGNAPAAVAAAVSGLQPATAYTVMLAASNAQGTASGATVVFTTPPSTAIATTEPPTTTTSTTSTTPRSLRISAVTESARSWRTGRRRATIARGCSKRCRPAVGTTFRFTLSRAASVRLTFARARRGKSRHRSAWVAAGSLVLTGHAGADTIGFDGRLAHGRLRAGSYRLTVNAAAGGRTVVAKPLRFTIVPARRTA